MIISQLAGGLGNQMFQYALGRSLALRNNDMLKLDVSNYTSNNVSRTYKLDHFQIKAEIASPAEIKRLQPHPLLISRLIRAFKFRILKIENVSFKPKLLQRKGDIYLEGYWQSEKYFTDIAETIRQDFSLKAKMVGAAEDLDQEIGKTAHPVSLHVRRGDYVANPLFNTCSPAYYQTALRLINDRVADPRFFIFSDDIAWVREHLKLPTSAYFVSDPTIDDYEELALMSRCHHHIIANSSFSWWGAWLNPRPDKIVVAPKLWFSVSPKMYKDIVPTSWIKI